MGQQNPIDALIAWGKLVSLTIDVQRAYTGAQSTCLLACQSQPINPDLTQNDDWPIINLKEPGIRVITPGAVSGAQSGDTIPGYDAVQIATGFVPLLSTDMSGDTEDKWPIYVVEIETDQGITRFDNFSYKGLQL